MKGFASKSVLLIEDDENILLTLQLILAQERYTVHCAKNGAAALALLSRIPTPDLVIMDLMMPEMNGWQFLERIRRDARFTDLKVLIMSAAISQPPQDPCVVGFLPKPFAIDTLLDTVRSASESVSSREDAGRPGNSALR